MKKLILLVTALFLGLMLNANLNFVTISGTVYDSSGSTLDQVEITCTSPGIAMTSTETDTEGWYSINVPSGRNSTLTFSHSNSSTSVSKNVNFSSNQSDFDITMSN